MAHSTSSFKKKHVDMHLTHSLQRELNSESMCPGEWQPSDSTFTCPRLIVCIAPIPSICTGSVRIIFCGATPMANLSLLPKVNTDRDSATGAAESAINDMRTKRKPQRSNSIDANGKP